MAAEIVENKRFEKENFSDQKFARGEYENCRFKDCNFSGSDLSDLTFIDCEFELCNLSMTKARNTALKTVRFLNCKLLGFNFSDCNNFLLSVNFENCLLNLASFFKLKLKATKFKNCNLQEADFTEADLTNSVFENCDLGRAIFERTILEKADFRTAYAYSFDPEKNRIKKAKFSYRGIAGLLEKYNITID